MDQIVFEFLFQRSFNPVLEKLIDTSLITYQVAQTLRRGAVRIISVRSEVQFFLGPLKIKKRLIPKCRDEPFFLVKIRFVTKLG